MLEKASVMLYFTDDCVSSELNEVACESSHLTIACNHGSFINIESGYFGRTVPYRQQCDRMPRFPEDTNCASEESTVIVSEI